MMKKTIFIFLLFTIGCGKPSMDVIYFRNEYNGLCPGYSTLKDVKKILGEPERIEKTINGRNYHFEKVIVNFSGKHKKHINTIQIINDREYVSPGGVKLFDSLKSAKQKVLQEDRNYLFDNINGIAYFHDGKIITKIVLASFSYRDLRDVE